MNLIFYETNIHILNMDGELFNPKLGINTFFLLEDWRVPYTMCTYISDQYLHREYFAATDWVKANNSYILTQIYDIHITPWNWYE